MLWRRAQNDSLVGRLCEDEGNGQRILRKAYGWPPWVLGGHADALECRLGDLHPLKSYQFSSAASVRSSEHPSAGLTDGPAGPSEDFPILRRSCACVEMFNNEHKNA